MVGAQAVGGVCVRIALRDVKPGAHFVFEATVMRAVGLSGGRNIVDLDVGRVWKGEVHRRTRLFYDSGTIDTQHLEVGRRYVIFAPWFAFLDFTDARRVHADLDFPTGCAWAQPYDEVEAELPTLGTAKRAR